MPKLFENGQVPGLYRRNFGSFRISTVHDGMLDTAFDHIIGLEHKKAETMHRAALLPTPPRLSTNCFVIERNDRIYLVDTGCGITVQNAGKQSAGLSALGIKPGDIDVVLMTHLHSDHLGGLVDSSGTCLFPNAEILVHEDELNFWTEEANFVNLGDDQKGAFVLAAPILNAYAKQIRAVGAGEVAPGISVVPTPGHTPGHTAWLLESDRKGLLIWGDVVHMPAIQFHHPEAAFVYDVDPEVAVTTRRKIFDMAAAEQLLVAGVHLDFPCFGRVETRSGGGFNYTSEVWTSDV